MSMGRIFLGVLFRDLKLVWLRRTEPLLTLAFFVLTGVLFAVGTGADTEQLRMLAPGIIWVTTLLAVFLSIHHVFALDYADGTLEQMLLSPEPTSLLVLAKILAHWIATGFPVILVSPVLGLLFDMEYGVIGILVCTLLLGTPILMLVGAVGAALTLGLRGSGLLQAILVLPLFVPVLIFGSGAVAAYRAVLDVQDHLFLLAAGLLLGLVLAPIACASALKISLDS